MSANRGYKKAMSGNKPRLGRPPIESPKDGVVRFRCRREEKGNWVRKSREAGKTLSKWLIDLANGSER